MSAEAGTTSREEDHIWVAGELRAALVRASGAYTRATPDVRTHLEAAEDSLSDALAAMGEAP